MMELGDEATTPTPSNSKCATPEFKPDKPYELKYIELCGQVGFLFSTLPSLQQKQN